MLASPQQEPSIALGQILADLNHLGRELVREDREQDRMIIFKDASRLHLIPSPLQRPYDHEAGLQARPVWDLASLKPQNRWSSKASMTGVGLAGTHLTALEEQMEVVAREAAVLAEEVGKENSTWVRESVDMMLTGSAYRRGLYEWGKKRHLTCSITPKTCKILKKFTESSKCRKCLSKFVVLEAQSRQVPRVGPTNARLRALLPLELPSGRVGVTVAGEQVVMEKGRIVIVDDSFENMLWNESEEGNAVLLLVDFHHPDLKDLKKKDGYSEHGQNQFIIY